MALIGPSGAGKSTLLRSINGLNSFDEGEIRVGPHTLLAQPQPSRLPGARAGAAAVRHDLSRLPALSPPDGPGKRDGGAPLRAEALDRPRPTNGRCGCLDRVGLADRAAAYPQELSGGQKQRVAIARAMAMEPRGLLCDEITSALDPELKSEVLAVLEDLKRDGLTLIIVTHEIGFARRAADRVVVLADGKIIEDGDAQPGARRSADAADAAVPRARCWSDRANCHAKRACCPRVSPCPRLSGAVTATPSVVQYHLHGW